MTTKAEGARSQWRRLCRGLHDGLGAGSRQHDIRKPCGAAGVGDARMGGERRVCAAFGRRQQALQVRQRLRTGEEPGHCAQARRARVPIARAPQRKAPGCCGDTPHAPQPARQPHAGDRPAIHGRRRHAGRQRAGPPTPRWQAAARGARNRGARRRHPASAPGRGQPGIQQGRAVPGPTQAARSPAGQAPGSRPAKVWRTALGLTNTASAAPCWSLAQAASRAAGVAASISISGRLSTSAPRAAKRWAQSAAPGRAAASATVASSGRHPAR